MMELSVVSANSVRLKELARRTFFIVRRTIALPGRYLMYE